MRRFLTCAALALLLPPSARAAESPDNYPSRPITVVVPFTPGASSPRPCRASVTVTWVGLFAPAGTPASVVEKLDRAMRAALQKPDVVDKLKLQGVTALGQPPDAPVTRMREEVAHWGKVIPAGCRLPE